MTDKQANTLTVVIFLALYSGLIAAAQVLQVGAAPELSSLYSWVPALIYFYMFLLAVRKNNGVDPEKRFMTLRSSWFWVLFAAALVIVPFDELFGRLTGS